jgi:hypothetical protein
MTLATKPKLVEVKWDPFHPVLKTANPLAVNPEQEVYLRAILDVCCSDSRFAQKAYIAILAVLSQSTPEVLPPVLTSVTPNTGEVGIVPVPIVVVGTDFDSDSKVLWNGMTLNSSMFISETELHAELFMEDKIAGDFLIAVDKGGVISNTVPFTVTDPVVRSVVEKPIKPVEVSSKSIPHAPAPVKK